MVVSDGKVYIVPRIRVRRKYIDLPVVSEESHYIWRYLAEKIFWRGRWRKLNYYTIVSELDYYSILSVGQRLHFEFFVFRQLVA
jgi:hypothetical protein